MTQPVTTSPLNVADPIKTLINSPAEEVESQLKDEKVRDTLAQWILDPSKMAVDWITAHPESSKNILGHLLKHPFEKKDDWKNIALIYKKNMRRLRPLLETHKGVRANLIRYAPDLMRLIYPNRDIPLPTVSKDFSLPELYQEYPVLAKWVVTGSCDDLSGFVSTLDKKKLKKLENLKTKCPSMLKEWVGYYSKANKQSFWGYLFQCPAAANFFESLMQEAAYRKALFKTATDYSEKDLPLIRSLILLVQEGIGAPFLRTILQYEDLNELFFIAGEESGNALHFACEIGSVEFLKILSESNRDALLQEMMEDFDSSGNLPIQKAAEAIHQYLWATNKSLLMNTVKLENESGNCYFNQYRKDRKFLINALYREDPEKLKTLLKKPNKDGYPLFLNTEEWMLNHYLTLFPELIEEINVKNGQTSLHFFARYRPDTLALVLLPNPGLISKLRKMLDVVDREGNKPLHISAMQNKQICNRFMKCCFHNLFRDSHDIIEYAAAKNRAGESFIDTYNRRFGSFWPLFKNLHAKDTASFVLSQIFECDMRSEKVGKFAFTIAGDSLFLKKYLSVETSESSMRMQTLLGSVNEQGNTLLHETFLKKNISFSNDLLTENKSQWLKLSNTKNATGQYPLHCAAQAGILDLIEDNPQANSIDSSEGEPHSREPNYLNHLIDNGLHLQFSERDQWGRIPLHYAFERGHFETFKQLESYLPAFSILYDYIMPNTPLVNRLSFPIQKFLFPVEIPLAYGSTSSHHQKVCRLLSHLFSGKDRKTQTELLCSLGKSEERLKRLLDVDSSIEPSLFKRIIDSADKKIVEKLLLLVPGDRPHPFNCTHFPEKQKILISSFPHLFVSFLLTCDNTVLKNPAQDSTHSNDYLAPLIQNILTAINRSLESPFSETHNGLATKELECLNPYLSLALGLINRNEETVRNILSSMKHPQANQIVRTFSSVIKCRSWMKKCLRSRLENHLFITEPSHLIESAKPVTIPEAASIPIYQLLSIASELNMDNPKAPDYIDLCAYKDGIDSYFIDHFRSKSIDSHFVQTSLAKILRYYTRKTHFTMTPPAFTPEITRFYDNIASLIKTILYLLNETKATHGADSPIYKKARNDALIKMAIASNHCGQRWNTEFSEIALELQTGGSANNFPTATSGLLENYRFTILQKFAQQVCWELQQDNYTIDPTHAQAVVIRHYGNQFGVRGANNITGNDVCHREYHKILELFPQEYTPSSILDLVEIELSINERYKDQFIAHLKKEWAPEWKKETYSKLTDEIKSLPNWKEIQNQNFQKSSAHVLTRKRKRENDILDEWTKQLEKKGIYTSSSIVRKLLATHEWEGVLNALIAEKQAQDFLDEHYLPDKRGTYHFPRQLIADVLAHPSLGILARQLHLF